MVDIVDSTKCYWSAAYDNQVFLWSSFCLPDAFVFPFVLPSVRSVLPNSDVLYGVCMTTKWFSMVAVAIITFLVALWVLMGSRVHYGEKLQEAEGIYSQQVYLTVWGKRI